MFNGTSIENLEEILQEAYQLALKEVIEAKIEHEKKTLEEFLEEINAKVTTMVPAYVHTLTESNNSRYGIGADVLLREFPHLFTSPKPKPKSSDVLEPVPSYESKKAKRDTDALVAWMKGKGESQGDHSTSRRRGMSRR